VALHGDPHGLLPSYVQLTEASLLFSPAIVKGPSSFLPPARTEVPKMLQAGGRVRQALRRPGGPRESVHSLAAGPAAVDGLFQVTFAAWAPHLEGTLYPRLEDPYLPLLNCSKPILPRVSFD
jgi:hypothetical protein